MFNYSQVKALLIDIDDTIVRFKTDDSSLVGNERNAGSLFDVLAAAAVELRGLTPWEAKCRIEKVKTEIRWWHWSDFIVALELNPRRFWEYAYEMERLYIEPTGPEILPVLERLRDRGILLYITSNNPSSGILHKLRLAGVAHINGTRLFDQLLGAPEMQSMKWEPVYWKKVLAHTGLDAHEVAVVGDNEHDDFAVPREAGITHSFILNRYHDRSGGNDERVTYVRSFTQIEKCLLPENNKRSGKVKWQPTVLSTANV